MTDRKVFGDKEAVSGAATTQEAPVRESVVRLRRFSLLETLVKLGQLRMARGQQLLETPPTSTKSSTTKNISATWTLFNFH